MQMIGIGELQKNMGILTHLTEALTVVDKRKNKEVAVIYPLENSRVGVIDGLAGKYSHYAKKSAMKKSFSKIREEAMMEAMKEKYGLSD